MPGYRTVLLLLALAGAVVGGCLAQRQQESAHPQQQGAYVGSEVCLGCHADLAENFRTTAHAKLLAQAPPESAAHWGCEACHGPGEAHVSAGGGKGVGGLITFRDESAQARAQVCLTCHREVRSSFALPVRHKVLEGSLGCTDCHTPHGSQSRFAMRGVHNETCTRCHVEKGGPFAFEHLASRIEGCTSCHLPHGSTNKFLLKRHEERVLCLECHSNAPLFHNQAPGAFFQGACTRCHTEIHGSNFDRFFFH